MPVKTEVSTALPEAFSEKALLQISSAARDPEWLKELRLAGLSRAQEVAPPSRDMEAWRRTDPTRFRLEGLSAATPAAPASAEQVAGFIHEAEVGEVRGGLLVTVDGVPALREAARELSVPGLVFTDFVSGLREHDGRFRAQLFAGQAVDTLDRWSSLNAAFATGGACVRVPRGAQLELPLWLLHRLEAPSKGLFLHTLICAEEGASVTVVEVLDGSDAAGGLVHASVDVVAEPGAQVHYLRMQEVGRDTLFLSRERLAAHRDAQVDWSWGALGARMAKSEMEAHLLGEGARAMISGFYHGGGTQHLDHHTFQNHLKGNTTSDLLYKGALEERARSVYMGVIKIHQDAQRSDAYQANRNLILSNAARSDSIPSLEIEANDVRCTHGATMGQVDEEQLFYLLSRGLSRADATRLIVEGFYEPVFDRIASQTVREFSRARLQKRLSL